MEIMFITIIIISAILVSIVFNHFFPFLSLPLIQILIGFVIGLTSIGHDIFIEPELILIIIIAPLLYNEAKNINTTKLWKNRVDVMVVAFPMVLISVIALGFFFKATLFVMPLAACFALASALAPTDLVTVSSLSKRMHIPLRNKIILEGEGLINDASGITAFQISALALATGKFSLLYSIERLFIICLGGVLVGLIIYIIKNRIVHVIRRSGIEDIKFYLILDFLLPFLSFLIAEELHVSGILATVTVGLLEAVKITRSSLFDAKLNALSDSTWQVIVTILNAVVFIYLGVQLPLIIEKVVEVYDDNILYLFFIIFVATIVLFLVRYILFVFYKIYKDGFKSDLKLKDQLILTLSGVKGSVTLATISSLPFVLANNKDFNQRYVLIFVAAGVIVLSILTAIILLPLLLDKKEENDNNEYEVAIAREVIKLLEQQKTPKNQAEVDAVIKVYSDRIVHYYIQTNGLSFKQQKKIDREILRVTLDVEYNELNKLYKNNEISQQAYDIYNRVLGIFSKKSNRLFHFRFNLQNTIFRFFITHPKKRVSRLLQDKEKYHDVYHQEVKKIFVINGEKVINALEKLETKTNSKYLKLKIKDEARLIDLIANDRQFDSLLVNINPNYTKEMENGLQFERFVVQKYYEDGLINNEQHAELKRNINVLEEYYMMDTNNNLTYHFLNQFFMNDRKDTTL